MSKFSRIIGRNLHLLAIVLILLSSLVYLQYKIADFERKSMPSLPISDYLCRTIFPRNLSQGDAGSEVTLLQEILNLSPDTRVAEVGNGSPGEESGYFGQLTHSAVVRFQEKYDVDTVITRGEIRGTGTVGSSTREALREECSGFLADINKSQAQGPSPSDAILLFRLKNNVEQFFDNKGVVDALVVIIVVWGINFVFWGFIGLLRLLSETISRLTKKLNGIEPEKSQIDLSEVAVIVPAHNEELVIAETLFALLGLVRPKNLFLVSDGSKDRTGEIARKYRVNVLELNPGKGKAGALEEAVRYFDIQNRYKVVVLVDADTRLKHDYLEKGLPYFNDPEVVAVAGYACTMWNRKKLNWRQILFVLHRDRVYFLFQMVLKFGQTWKYTNVAHIVPGFASMYRTSVLDKINMNPKGLVIEDFNMTFEVHHKQLGRIAHHPSIVAYTQDPDNVIDYYKQIRRWHLGFWQTVKLHGFWPSKFWATMLVTLTEGITGSVLFLLLPFMIVAYLLVANTNFSTLLPTQINSNYLIATLAVTWISDYTLTLIVAIAQGRKEYLLVGLFFPLVRFIDGFAFLFAIPRAYLVRSDGRWVSPSRRAL